jgi:glutathione S-transferase
MGTTNKTDAWIAKFGASQVPAFEGADGTIIIESGAIAYYRKFCLVGERKSRRRRRGRGWYWCLNK